MKVRGELVFTIWFFLLRSFFGLKKSKGTLYGVYHCKLFTWLLYWSYQGDAIVLLSVLVSFRLPPFFLNVFCPIPALYANLPAFYAEFSHF